MRARPIEWILWIEGTAFSLLIILGWAAEFFQVPHLLFGEPGAFNWARPILKTFIIIAIWTIVHLGTRRLLRRLHRLEEYLLVCAWCHKIGHEGKWMTMEAYFGSALSTPTTHGICPECSARLRRSVESDETRAD